VWATLLPIQCVPLVVFPGIKGSELIIQQFTQGSAREVNDGLSVRSTSAVEPGSAEIIA
jgi:hypothetical protein